MIKIKYKTWYIACILALSFSCSKPTINNEEIMAQLELDANEKTEVVKKFPQHFPETLIARGEPTIYTRKNSNNFEYIGMPIGGIAAGQLYLGGDGQLWFWDIFSLNHNHGQFKGEEAYEFPYERSKPNEFGARMIEQGFSITTTVDGERVTKNLNRDGFKNIEFIGQYPIGKVTYSDTEMPVQVKIEAYSPFIPLDLDNSILPATIFEFEIKNTSNKAIEVDLNAWMENAILIGSREQQSNLKGKLVNQIKDADNNGLRINYTVNNADENTKNKLDYGSMSLSLISEDGIVSTDSKREQSMNLSDSTKLVSNLFSTVKLSSGESTTAKSILTWYFPKTYATENKWEIEENRISGADTTRYYSKIYKDANDVSKYLIKNYETLSGKTKTWHETWYNSTLPYWFLDRTFVNTSILASSTVSLVGNKMYYATEGGNQGPGTCTHVYGYTQAPGRLFPELEQSIREQVDFVPVSEGGALMENGGVHFRWFGLGMAVDGQSGIIMKSYQIHQMSSDGLFLKNNYNSIKTVMNGLVDNNDADHDGILTGAQHNTLDADWYGKVTWLSLYYTTALRAMAEMAKEVGDAEYAEFCLATADKGRKYIEDYLFNGEYFIHEGDSLHPESPGTYTGLEYSQLLGQYWAYQAGLGEVVDPTKAKKALESMWRYNFTTDVDTFRKVHPTGRWYAMPGEGGIIACTWPNGGSEVLANGDPRYAAYNNECQNGYEYAASSVMMSHGMPYHSLAHVWYMDQNRYHGSKRNPYCEIEWGLHYGRSMASYGHLIAVSGFEYHGPKGYIAFAPKITPWHFRSGFTTSEGWGTFEQTQKRKQQINEISLAYGRLKLNTIVLTVSPQLLVKNLTVSIGDEQIACEYERKNDRVHISLKEKLVLNANNTLTVLIKN